MVDFAALLARDQQARKDLDEIKNMASTLGIELMVAVGRWWECVNYQKRSEMAGKLFRWLKENEASK